MKTKELLDSGAIGRPYFVQANYWESIGQATFLEDLEGQLNAGGNWRYDPQLSGGGVLMDGCTHWVRPMRIWYVYILLHPCILGNRGGLYNFISDKSLPLAVKFPCLVYKYD